MPSPNNRIEKGTAELIGDESEPEDISNTGAQVIIDVLISTIEGEEGVVDVNPLVTNGLSYHHLDESTFIFRIIMSNFSF